MKPVFAAQSDIGLFRNNNEDSYIICPELGLIAVADGIGGLEAGEVASQLATISIQQSLNRSHESPIPSLREAIYQANLRIIDYAGNQGMLGRMGTTLIAALFHGNQVTFNNIGDSRIYCVRNREIIQKSLDHTLLNEYLRLGLIKKEDAPTFPYKHVITKALGIERDINVLIQQEDLQINDLWLLCTDGLTDMLKDSEILDIVLMNEDHLEECCKTLIQRANERGGRDNITIALAYIQDN